VTLNAYGPWQLFTRLQREFDRGLARHQFCPC